jgi:hypothetical protein
MLNTGSRLSFRHRVTTRPVIPAQAGIQSMKQAEIHPMKPSGMP